MTTIEKIIGYVFGHQIIVKIPEDRLEDMEYIYKWFREIEDLRNENVKLKNKIKKIMNTIEKTLFLILIVAVIYFISIFI